MTTLREAAQQALEALEADCCGGCDAEYNPCRQRRLAESLRAALAQQAEPLNLRDPAVQKRLATQWGYVPAAQAEPVEPVATLTAQRDALLEALRMFVSCAIPVSTKIDERGYGWTQAYLDQALPKARAAIKAVEETK